jgi:hypothetical protein
LNHVFFLDNSYVVGVISALVSYDRFQEVINHTSLPQNLNIDKMKAMMNQGVQEDKLDQNEELANLRADTSLEKQEMANENRLTLARMKPKTNWRT